MGTALKSASVAFLAAAEGTEQSPWTLTEADVVSGRTLTSWPSLQTDIRNAGGTWVDEQVVVGNKGLNALVTSRRPQDLPAFCDALIRVFGEATG